MASSASAIAAAASEIRIGVAAGTVAALVSSIMRFTELSSLDGLGFILRGMSNANLIKRLLILSNKDPALLADIVKFASQAVFCPVLALVAPFHALRMARICHWKYSRFTPIFDGGWTDGTTE